MELVQRRQRREAEKVETGEALTILPMAPRDGEKAATGGSRWAEEQDGHGGPRALQLWRLLSRDFQSAPQSSSRGLVEKVTLGSPPIHPTSV